MAANDNFISAPYPTIPSGTKIVNRYLIQAILGKGGLGRTYLAFDSYRFNEPCVLKEFAPVMTSTEQIEKSRILFEREAQILYNLKHPQIPQFYAAFTAENRLFLVQQYVQGKSYYQLLQQRLRQGQTFSEQEILTWLLDLLPVLEYIHDRGIIHRDISPDNIMQLYDEKLPILIDFGVGKQAVVSEKFQQVSSAVAQRTFVGKIGYAPEEQMNFGICYPCSDLYSLAVTAIVLLTGKQPNTLLNLYTLEWEWRSYTNISDTLSQVLDKLLNRNPKSRYQSATEVIFALQEISNLNRSVIKPNQQFTIDKPQVNKNIVTKSKKSLEENSAKLTINQNYFSPNAKIVKYYEKQLAYYIGPIASLIIEEILTNNSIDSYQELIEALMINIPDVKQQLEFKRNLV
ncbi:serine/threonine protein kinase [Stanieria cyanosphaera PCC 7437]|uniref:non-specific serine/threonine protein kinase n=1 Tax=Stanieria cyanosphaera (strain ATCC 29371 / PCC 7437) TaxID=111780 RepID=K9XYQ7_STAC7|nr:serine/threonine-protein kinase [Stanieria cyanosphaera]AFZ36812.1 serine/threonine protein kinase [Stanieria cyanosphaera PCC 7437]